MRAGIPTTGRDGTRFRSRLEARWAALFTSIGWQWEYEPFEVEGYIPDFAILGKNPFLVEVKPALSVKELEPHVTKAKKMERDLLLVGAAPILPGSYRWGYATAGLLLQWDEYVEEEPGFGDPDGKGGILHGMKLKRSGWEAEALWHRCGECQQIALHHSEGSFHGYPCDHYDGDGYLGPLEDSVIESLWAQARNATQWKAR